MNENVLRVILVGETNELYYQYYFVSDKVVI